jgi:hypothetical protein
MSLNLVTADEMEVLDEYKPVSTAFKKSDSSDDEPTKNTKFTVIGMHPVRNIVEHAC